MRDLDQVRADAAFDAVLFDRGQALPDLVEGYVLHTDDPVLRYFLVQLMGFSGSKAAVKPLILALDDPDPSVRAEACRGLEDLRARKAHAALRARLTDMSREVREAAADALKRIGG
ncbi:MAG: HEAT repeat domain-containing protein [Deltaproteobacteria bacterium]|nr:HEAT repeat domain-containing protein [Deltaproteobacteria bacterium]